MQFYAIPCIIANVTKKHMSEDDILFTKPLAGIGLMQYFTVLWYQFYINEKALVI